MPKTIKSFTENERMYLNTAAETYLQYWLGLVQAEADGGEEAPVPFFCMMTIANNGGIPECFWPDKEFAEDLLKFLMMARQGYRDLLEKDDDPEITSEDRLVAHELIQIQSSIIRKLAIKATQ